MAKKKRYLLRDSDRSGFTFRDIELVSDDGHLVGPDEFDAPPPSPKIYKDEGGVSPDEYQRNNWDSYAATKDRTTQIINPTDEINLVFAQDNTNFQIKNPLALFYVAGVSAQTILTSDPQIPASTHGDKISVQCTSNNLIIRNGSGLRLYTEIYNMRSGDLVNLVYNATDGLWCESSRGPAFGNILGEY